MTSLETGMGLSRDDYVRFSQDFADRKIFKNEPIQVLEQEGIGQLVEIGAIKGWQANPGLEAGIRGEHGGESESLGFWVGMDYVSCSPYRVPIARRVHFVPGERRARRMQ